MTTGKPSARALLVAAMLALTLAACGGQSTGAGPTHATKNRHHRHHRHHATTKAPGSDAKH